MKGRGGSSQRRARELALQALYAIDLGLRRVGRPPLTVRDVALEAPAGEVEAALEEAVAQAVEPDVEAVGLDPEAARDVFDGIAAHFEAPPAAQEAAWDLVAGVCANSDLLDDRIGARARNWRVVRMAAVDRNILRLGAYELGHTTAPGPVVIDEAVDLARRYGSDRSPAFVNGILDALAGDLRPGSAAGAG